MACLQRLVGAVAATAALFATADARAQLFRAYLAVDGSDTNPCTVQAPCRLLPAALAAVADGGEVWMLGSANYNTGPVTVAKSVTILAVPGARGSLVVNGGTALTINTAGVRVALRNVSIGPLPGQSGNGIEMYAGTSLLIDRCIVAGLAFGVYAQGSLQVTVRDSRFADNIYGLAVSSGVTARVSGSHFTGHTGSAVQSTGLTAPVVSLSVAQSVVVGNRVGISAIAQNSGSSARLAVADTVIESSEIVGVEVFSISGSVAQAAVSRSTFTRNGAGVSALGAGTHATVSRSTFTLGDTGLRQGTARCSR
jgi:hypothetical protein